MQEIQTAQWMETHTHWRQPGGEEGGPPPTTYWIRLSPPAQAHHTDFENSWSHSVMDERGHLTTGSSWDVCHCYPHRRPFAAANLLRRVLFTPPAAPDADNSPANRQPGHPWRQEQSEMDGHAVVRWQREYIKDNFQVVEEVWTQPETQRIVRKERRETDMLTGQPAFREVCDRYVYNAPLPDGTFDMPAGKAIVTPDSRNISREVWNDLTAREQQLIQATIDRSDAGWRDADFALFASAWNFGVLKRAPGQEEYAERVGQQAGLWSRWTSVIDAASLDTFVPIQTSTHSFILGRQKNRVLQVSVNLRVEWEDSAHWEGTAKFYLRRRGRGYRIIYWQCPWEEIKAVRGIATACG